MRLRRPTAGERKEGGEEGGGKGGGGGCQGGMTGMTGIEPTASNVCVTFFLISLSMCSLRQRFTLSVLAASVPAKASSGNAGWESLESWAPFKTSNLRLMLQLQNYVYSLKPLFSKTKG